ncbi:MAG: DUF6252 family protein [Cyclobacteriaceae bacterium]|nr:DUF6252 family protein [Cyclobacteriaceae bacterium]
MKKLLLNLAILTLITLHFSGCDLFGKKEEPKPKTELEKLPPITQEGKNTFGCLVNGKAWVAATQTDAVAFYQLGTLQISGNLSQPARSVGITLRDEGIPINTGKYSLIPTIRTCSSAGLAINQFTTCLYDCSNTLFGQIEISKLDRKNYIVSGTFEFSTVVSGCDTLKITNGRFDIKYIP